MFKDPLRLTFDNFAGKGRFKVDNIVNVWEEVAQVINLKDLYFEDINIKLGKDERWYDVTLEHETGGEK